MPRRSTSLLLLAFLLTSSARAFSADTTKRPGDTGHFKVSFAQCHPLSQLEEFNRRTAHQGVANEFPAYTPAGISNTEYDITNESFDLAVPKTYDRRIPHGLFVWIGVTEYSPEWLDVFARHDIIFITANNTGGRGWTIRQGLALDAVHNIQKFYNIDPGRIFIAGFSAGGSMAAETLQQFPDVFSGGVFLMGGYFFLSISDDGILPLREGQHREPTVLAHMNWHGPIEPLKTKLKIVIMKGEGDPTSWKAAEGQSDYEALLLDGFTHVNLFVLPKWGHMHPNADQLDKAITAIDAEPTRPPTTKPTKDPHPQPGQIAQAKRLLFTAKYIAHSWAQYRERYVRDRLRKKSIEDARRYLQQVLDQYPTTPAAAEAAKLINELDRLMDESAAATQPAATQPNSRQRE